MARANGKRQVAIAATLCVISLLVAGTGAVATEGSSLKSAAEVEAIAPSGAIGQQGPDISIQNFSAPDEVQVGMNFTVTAEVVNDGDNQVIRRVSYRITGNVIQSRPVLVPANDAEVVQFDVTEATTREFSPGTYTHGVFADGAEATANLTLTADDETATTEGTPTSEETPTPEETPEETTPESPTANVSFENQTSNGTAVTVESATVPEGGFVVIHDESIIEGTVVDSTVGESEFLDAGTHQNVTIRLDESLNESQRLVAVVYRDSNDNREYDFAASNRTVDGPYTQQDSRTAVNRIAFISVEEEEER